MSFKRGLNELRSALDVDSKIRLAPLLDVVGQAWVVADALCDEAVQVDELVSHLLQVHRDYHTEPSPKFCSIACQLAAAL